MNKEKRLSYKTTNCGGFWPNREQELLLRASLLQGPEVIESWYEWRSIVDLDHIDPGSIRLFPLLYHNLKSQGIEDPLMNIFEWVYRITMSKNQILFHKMSEVLTSFHNAGIQTMILKGTALTLLHYRDFGLRPMVDFDVLVPRKKASAAIKRLAESDWTSTITPLKGFSEIKFLNKLGWTPKIRPIEEFTNAYFSVRHAHEFVDPEGHICDLHWRLLQGTTDENADDEFWDGAVKTTVSRLSTRALNPTDLLFHVCVHGARWNFVPSLRWIPDAMLIMNTSQSEIDWNRLVTLSKRTGQVLPIRDTLDYLRHHFSFPVPPSVLEELQNVSVSQITRMEHKAKTRSPRLMDGFLEVHFLCRSYARQVRGAGLFSKLAGFPKFLQNIFGMDQLRQLPLYVLFELVRRTGQLIRSASNRSAKMVSEK